MTSQKNKYTSIILVLFPSTKPKYWNKDDISLTYTRGTSLRG